MSGRTCRDPPVVRNHTVAALSEEEHLRVPIVRSSAASHAKKRSAGPIPNCGSQNKPVGGWPTSRIGSAERNTTSGLLDPLPNLVAEKSSKA